MTTSTNILDYETTGVTRRPRTGEFFICPNCLSTIVLRMLVSKDEPRNVSTGDGGGWTPGVAKIVVPVAAFDTPTVRVRTNVTFEVRFGPDEEYYDLTEQQANALFRALNEVL